MLLSSLNLKWWEIILLISGVRMNFQVGKLKLWFISEALKQGIWGCSLPEAIGYFHYFLHAMVLLVNVKLQIIAASKEDTLVPVFLAVRYM